MLPTRAGWRALGGLAAPVNVPPLALLIALRIVDWVRGGGLVGGAGSLLDLRPFLADHLCEWLKHRHCFGDVLVYDGRHGVELNSDKYEE